MKKNHMLFPMVFFIYIAAGICSLILFRTNGSNLSHQLDVASVSKETDVPASEPVILETPAPAPVDTTPDPVITEEQAEEPADIPEPDESELPEEPSAPQTDEIDETEDTDDTETEEDGKTYYAFAVNQGVIGVRVRETSGRRSNVIGSVSSGDKGYVLETGDNRTKIVTEDGLVCGYVYNEYITITEISKKDYPKEYR